MKTFLQALDERIYNFLSNHAEIMPLRLTKMIAAFYGDARTRRLYWQKLGVNFGEGSFVNPGFTVSCATGDNYKNLFIGNHVSIAPNVTIILDSEPNNSPLLCSVPYVRDHLIRQGQRITIEDDVWIGASVTILPGVTLKKGSIIGAGSVVTKDTEEFSVYAGVPARKLKSLDLDGIR